MLIEIAGGIASGKTTLARALARFEIFPVYENHSLNLYWEAFYRHPEKFAFETEISFVLQHYHFAKLASAKGNRVLLDHSFELDLAYARMGLDGKRQSIVESIYWEIRKELTWPSVLVWIHCSPQVELDRIRARGRDTEADIGLGFLSMLNEHLQQVIREHESELANVIEIDAEAIDFRESGGWLQSLRSEAGLVS